MAPERTHVVPEGKKRCRNLTVLIVEIIIVTLTWNEDTKISVIFLKNRNGCIDVRSVNRTVIEVYVN